MTHTADQKEKIYDVAVSDDAGENTVDIENATYSNSIGEAYISTFWEDPDFNPNLSAFYYVRVLEIPTPRWTTYDSAVFDIDIPSYVPRRIKRELIHLQYGIIHSEKKNCRNFWFDNWVINNNF